MNPSIKKDFPQLSAHPKLVYLDSTATSLTPSPVIDAISNYYKNSSSSVHRGIYPLAAKTTQDFEEARNTIAHFINADPEEIIFTKNATEGLNLLAATLGEHIKDQPAEIITSISEHHSNFIPWQNLAKDENITHKTLGLTDQGECTYVSHEIKTNESNPEKLVEMLSPEKQQIISLAHISNVLGTIRPIEAISSMIKQKNPKAIFIVDACQSVPHKKIDVKKMGIDALVFSGHKMCGPTGIGVVWAKKELLEKIPPFLYGGEMVHEVYIDKQNTYKESPHKFEAGTPHVAGVIGLAAAATYLENIGRENIEKHERMLTRYFLEKATMINEMKIIGPASAKNRSATISFTLEKIHPHDIADFLGEKNIAVRAGLHCAMPLHTYFNIPATTRASMYVYNTTQDIDALFDALKELIQKFSK